MENFADEAVEWKGDDILCDTVDKVWFTNSGDGRRIELHGISQKFLESVAVRDLKLNFNGYLVNVTRVDPTKCTVEFDPEALPTNLDMDQIPVNVVIRGQHMDSKWDYNHTTAVGQAEPDLPDASGADKKLSTEVANKQEMFLRRLRGEGHMGYLLLEQCLAELLGTMIIVVFGVGSVCTAVLTEAQVGIWQIAVVWGFGVAFAIYTTASISGAHLNPAVSLAFAMFRPLDFHWKRLVPYWIAQILGGMLGGAINLGIFRKWYDLKDPNRDTLLYASTFGEYFPNPGLWPDPEDQSLMYVAECMAVEAWGAGILMFMILVFTDPRNQALKSKDAAPFLIGFTVASLISLYAPLQQAGWNPARDFGPRIIAAIAGYGTMAIPGPRNGFWAYIVGPLIGAPLGALVYDVILARGLRKYD
ncbi:hypothetical protein NDN08_003283 [Rhodosorus marinus]|uniref:Aquaporin n=1 Tax=Rhodosorus marinus TaxID=101924 RepID=A0AAV8UZQ8_9RHOD|nr:hypothetical protein NDN08_003283 [Rhodosorus marinus]